MSEVPTLIFDAECGFCTAGVSRLQRLAGRPTEALPSTSAEARRLTGDDGPPRQLRLVHRGRVFGGAEAIARTLALNWRLGPLAAGYWLPGVRELADAGYAFVAARRDRLSACLVPAGSGSRPANSRSCPN